MPNDCSRPKPAVEDHWLEREERTFDAIPALMHCANSHHSIWSLACPGDGGAAYNGDLRKSSVDNTTTHGAQT